MGFIKNRYASNKAQVEWGIDEDTDNVALLRVAEVTLTSAQILALHTTPVSIIAAQGAGKVIVIDKVVGFIDYGAATYSLTTSTLNLDYKADASGNTAASLANAFVVSTANAYGIGLGTIGVPLANEPIVATLGSAATVGDSPITLIVYYKVVDYN